MVVIVETFQEERSALKERAVRNMLAMSVTPERSGASSAL